VCPSTPSNRKNWRLEKFGDSGTKPVMFEILLVQDLLQYLATAGEMTQQEF